jgi:hypothetical protein
VPTHDGYSEYVKAAQHRLADALELLEEPTYPGKSGNPQSRHLRGAMYLAGYAVECILKAYIITRHPPCRTLVEVDPTLVAAAGHGLDRLLVTSGLEAQLLDRRQDWGICRSWTPDWRYNPQIPSRGEALNFVQSAERIHRWLKNQV